LTPLPRKSADILEVALLIQTDHSGHNNDHIQSDPTIITMETGTIYDNYPVGK
jgi:hypothetical protein